MHIKLIAKTEVMDKSIPASLAAFNAATCYQPTTEDARKQSSKIPVDNLRKTPHKTPFESDYLTFEIDNIPVSLVTFGLHERNPFYNSLQRSFRYAVLDDMSDTMHDMAGFISSIATPSMTYELMSLIQEATTFYQENLHLLEPIAKQALKDERPYLKNMSEKDISRIVQEQARCILSTAIPTGLTYTVNPVALQSMYASAWNGPTRELFEDLAFVGGTDGYSGNFGREYEAKYLDTYLAGEETVLSHGPTVSVPYSAHNVGSMVDEEAMKRYAREFLSESLDLLHFSPRSSELALHRYAFDIHLSIMEYGQLQRHRTITRGNPIFTKHFEVPPLLRRSDEWMKFIDKQWGRYLELLGEDNALEYLQFVLPYGAMVKVETNASLMSWMHFISQRSCNRAQFGMASIAKDITTLLGYQDVLGAQCEVDDCLEGRMFCGRDMSIPIHESRSLI